VKAKGINTKDRGGANATASFRLDPLARCWCTPTLCCSGAVANMAVASAATLEIGTIDGDNGLLRIIGKGNKERLVPLPEPMLVSLRQ